ncbi:MAG: PKD domain-containing protein [Thermoplasmatota archaeon]
MLRHRLLPTLLLLIVLTLPVFPFQGEAGPGKLSPDGVQADGSPSPTRSYFQETEANNNWAQADALPISQNSTMELHGNLSSGSDMDFYYFRLTGGSGPVERIEVTPTYINASDDYDAFVGWFWGFYPDNNHAKSPDPDGLSLSLDIWYPIFMTYSPIHIHASYSGVYGFMVRALDPATFSGKMEYNFTVQTSFVNPADNTNNEAGAVEINRGESGFTGGLTTHEDLFDWYHVTAPHQIHPTALDMVISLGNLNPDYNDGTNDWGVEIDVWVKWDTRSSPGNFQPMQKYRIASASRTNFINAGCNPSPFSLSLERNCTEMYIGFMIQTFVISPNGQVTYGSRWGSASLSVSTNLFARIPNNRPVLKNGKVDPIKGTSAETFTFSVEYYDLQNETPSYIGVWLDGEHFQKLMPMPDEGSDHVAGVRYGIDVPGYQVGKDFDHTFNFSAFDGKDWALKDESGVGMFMGPYVDDNLAPQSEVGEGTIIELQEDSDPYVLTLGELFTDPNLDTVLNFGLKYPDGTVRMDYNDENIHLAIRDEGEGGIPVYKLFITPKPDVNGLFAFRLNATDGPNEHFAKFAEIDLFINVAPENDDPYLKYIDSSPVREWDENFEYDVDQGEMVEVSVVAQDVDKDDTLLFHWNIEEVLSDPRRGINFDFNETSGDMWFVTSDADVPGFTATVTVTDSQGGMDSFDLVYAVSNVNDPPWIKVPREKSTIEGEYIYIVPTFGDPDMDSGDIVTFIYDLGELEGNTPSSSIDFDQTIGRLVLQATSEAMNGEWDINITIVDLDGEADWGICHITIDNANDPPEVFDINLEQEDGNLTVIFHTVEAYDEDQDDILTYIWDFGDGTGSESGIDMKDIVHTFPRGGAYTVTLKVTDGETFSDERILIVTVVAPPPDPDLDKDGMMDVWELRFGLDPSDPLDADLDPDNDGLTNKQEHDHFERTGFYLNPFNPDTDGDGWKDGEEVEKGYDPYLPGSHPTDPKKDLNFLLWIFAAAAVFFALASIAAFVILYVRNRPKREAVPVAAAPAYPAQYDSLSVDSQSQLPQPGIPTLPPAEGYQDQQYYPGEAYQEQYYPDTPASGQESFPDDQWPGEYDPVYGEAGQVLPPEPEQSQPGLDLYASDQYMADGGEVSEPPELDPEYRGDASLEPTVEEDTGVGEAADQVSGVGTEVHDAKSSGLPPVPDLPDV